MNQPSLVVQGVEKVIHVQKQITGSGGFKVPQESIDKRAHKNKFTSNALSNDLPSKQELFAGLGINVNELPPSEKAILNSNISEKELDRKLHLLHINQQMIKEKQEAIYDVPKQSIHKEEVNENKSRSKQQKVEKDADFDSMLLKHREKMKTIESQYIEKRLKDSRYNPLRTYDGPVEEVDDQLEHTHLDQSQRGDPMIKRKIPKPRSFTPNVRVEYHSEKKKPDLFKMRKEQNDLQGPHGQFLSSILPSSKLRQSRSASTALKQEDFQQRFKDYLRNKHISSQRQLLDKSGTQKEFELFQSTSPNRERWKVKHSHKVDQKKQTMNCRLISSIVQ